ncbi:MAG: hypothetical protein A4E68_01305 [Syntrophaceae bacterium PtaB.Bin095]|nr:MAG: hypothetical protein A4E68_01305 [Syntrophaceae bacterium PtaB.Bin095]
MMAAGMRFQAAKIVSETGTTLPVIFSIRFMALLGVARRSGMEPEKPMCQQTNPLYAAPMRTGKSAFRFRRAISRARSPAKMRPNPQLIQDPTPPTKATIIAPLTEVFAIDATQSSTFFMGGVRARM